MPKALDLTGRRFGRLTVVRLITTKPRRKWLCRCSCGKEIAVAVDHLMSSHTQSCGCLRVENLPRGNKHHGWKGGRRRRQGGYIYVLMRTHPNRDERGYVAEHRLVVEKRLGRLLSAEEQVHHIDGDPANNQESNLHLFPNPRAHMDWHRRLEEMAVYD
jgi:hypothetical protein